MRVFWGDDADEDDARIVTDMYGTVTPRVHDYLRDRGVTPCQWDVLMDHFGRLGHHQACLWVSQHQTDAGRYDSYHAERALDRRSA